MAQKQTPKQHYNSIVRKAHTINAHLNNLRKECIELIEKSKFTATNMIATIICIS